MELKDRTSNRAWLLVPVLWRLVILLLLVSAVTIPQLADNIWTDESRTLYYIGATPQDGPTTAYESWVRLSENYWQAPGYYLILKSWAVFTGESFFTLRVPSWLLAVLSIAMVYRLGRRYAASAEVGFYAAVLFGFNAFYAYYAHDMRTYTLLVVLVLALVSAYHRLYDETNFRWRSYLWIGMIACALMYTHYFAAFPILVLLGYTFLHYWRRVNVMALLGAHVVAAVAFLPWLRVMWNGLQITATDSRQVDNYAFFDGLADLLHFIGNGNMAIVLLLVAVVLVYGETRAKGRTLLVVLLATYSLIWLLTRFYPIFTELRYVLYLWPFFAILLAFGVAQLRIKRVSPVIILGIWTIVFIGSLIDPEEQLHIHDSPSPPFIQLADDVQGHITADDALMWVAFPLTRYIQDEMLWQQLYPLNGFNSRVLSDTYATTDTYYRSQIEQIVGESGVVWVAHNPQNWTWRVGEVGQHLQDVLNFDACEGLRLGTATIVNLFARPHSDNVTYEFDDSGAVRLSVLRASYVRDGQVYTLIGWEVPPSNQNLSAGVHIEDMDGNFLTNTDVGLVGSGFQCHMIINDLTGVQTNAITTRLVVYSRNSGQRLTTVVDGQQTERPVIRRELSR